MEPMVSARVLFSGSEAERQHERPFRKSGGVVFNS